jgi:hypothetical protein
VRASDGGVSLPRLTRTTDGGVVDVPYDAVPLELGRLKLTPREAQPVGATLRLESVQASNCSVDAPLNEQYDIVAPSPRPSSLGTLRATVQRGMLPLGTKADRTCWEYVSATIASVHVELDPSAEPYARQLVYRVVVDGSPFPVYEEFMHAQAKPWYLKASAPDRKPGAQIYTTCGAQARGPSLSPGKHTVRMEAQLDELTLATEQIEIELLCPAAVPLGDAGQQDAAVPVAGSDAGSSSSNDASVSTMSDAAFDIVVPEEDMQEGGGCHLADSNRFDHAMWLALALLVGRRRRQQP